VATDPATWRGFRVSVFQQTEFNLRYRGIERDNLQLIGVQVDTPLGGPWYLPVQAAVATNDYLGYPGYGELLAGVGLQASPLREEMARLTHRLVLIGAALGGYLRAHLALWARGLALALGLAAAFLHNLPDMARLAIGAAGIAVFLAVPGLFTPRVRHA
jgi:hypothetical protein